VASAAPEVLLDAALDALLAGRRVVLPVTEAEREIGIRIAELLAVARDVRELPTPEFRQRLARELAGTSPRRAAVLRPYLSVRDAAAALDFYRTAFGATETYRLTEPGGRVGHAQMRLGDAEWMLADEYPEYGIYAPTAGASSGVRMHLSVPDVDAFVARAGAAGATVAVPPKDQFYGERTAKLVDPFGHVWQVATTKEVVPEDEIKRRFDRMLAGGSPPMPVPARTAAPRPGFHAVTPYLTVRRPAELIDFVKSAFEAVEVFRGTGSAGGTHAELRIGDSMVMIGGMEAIPKETPAAIYLYVPDVDRAYERALAAGATSLLPPTNQDYGDRNAWVEDRFGNTWYIAAPIAK
jgi:PhnB protein